MIKFLQSCVCCIVVLVINLSFSKAQGQDSSREMINSLYQMDSLGNKSGYKIEYLDKHLRVVYSKKHASYFRYAYYENGRYLCINLLNTGKLSLVDSFSHEPEKGKILLLNGIYLLRDRRGTVRMIHEYRKGNLILIKLFDKKGRQYIDIDYTYKYGGQEGSYKLIQHSEKKHGCIVFYIKKINNKWVSENALINCPESFEVSTK